MSSSPDALDVGFRVFKIDSSNMKDVYYTPGEYQQEQLDLFETNIKEDRSDLDLLYGCMLDWGLPLSMRQTTESLEGISVHTVDDGGDRVALMACFAEKISESVIKQIARRKPLRAVFRDSSFASSPARINVEEIFKMLSPETNVRVI